MLTLDTILNQRYQLQEKLSQYAGRQTWKAIDLETSPTEEVIIKLLAINPNVTWEAIKLFEREAQVLKNLDHPKIPNYRDYFTLDKQQESDLTWLVTVQDYIPGISLKQWLDKHHKMTDKQVFRIALEILDILIYLHELNPPIIHRDIKPSNLILGEDGHIYLVDFGAVQDKTRQEGATFTIVGSNGYAPPEQLWGQAIPASDLYALGATLIQLLTGKSPSELLHNNRLQFSYEIELNPNLVTWLEQLINPAPEKRIQLSRQAYEQLYLISQTKLPQTKESLSPFSKKIIISAILLFSTGISSVILYFTYQKYAVPRNVLYHLPILMKSIIRSQQVYLLEKGEMPQTTEQMALPSDRNFTYKIDKINPYTMITYGIPNKPNQWTPGAVTAVSFNPQMRQYTTTLCITTSPVTKIEDIPQPMMTTSPIMMTGNQRIDFTCAKGTKEYKD
ncbi:protein kinase domain-containing protein [Crocosphaera sp. XPORK-15E]|uniref:protein kinase domain-containing protein n=1 Tax=Crocosphaera sp. XPORK-15E TaxID=3110247 RepID=UPI002B1EA094|nr:protein kinase [Crocosphaera sp. XPORK-15E]MEA5534431.1 protein kinase [Crocosphaera sp. XPORK-15E]